MHVTPVQKDRVLLAVSTTPPWPVGDGYTLRVFNMLEELSRFWRITLLAPPPAPDAPPFPAEVAEYLRGVRQVAADPHSPPAFDVHTEAEAREIDARDAAERVSRASPVDAAAVVTSDDARRASRSGRR